MEVQTADIGRILSPEEAESYATDRDSGADVWRHQGQLTLKGDFVLYFPPKDGQLNSEQEIIRQRAYRLGLAIESPQTTDEKGRIEGLLKIPSPLIWEALEVSDENKAVDFPSTRAVSLLPYRGDPFANLADSKVVLFSEKSRVEGTMIGRIQSLAIEYINRQVQEGQMPQDLLDTAIGLLKYTKKAPEDPLLYKLEHKSEASGRSPEEPLVITKGSMGPIGGEILEAYGASVYIDGNRLVYQSGRLKRENQKRCITIAVEDNQEVDKGKLLLTKTAWHIIGTIPERVPGELMDEHLFYRPNGGRELTFSEAFQDKNGIWVIEARPLKTDTSTLTKMQARILEYVRFKAENGQMDSEVSQIIQGVVKYKHATLRPIGHRDLLPVYRTRAARFPRT